MKKKGALFIAMGFEAGLLLVVFVKVGQWLDEYYDTKGILTMLSVCIMLIVWFYQLIRLVRSLKEKDCV